MSGSGGEIINNNTSDFNSIDYLKSEKWLDTKAIYDENLEWDLYITILEWSGFILKLTPFLSFFGYLMDFVVEAFLFIKNDNYDVILNFMMERANYPTNDSFLYHFEKYWKDLQNIRYYEFL